MLISRIVRSLAAASIVLIVAAPAGLAQTGGVTHVDTIPAPSLRNNLVGDADKRLATVYLPPGYAKNRTKRYPVVYLLHGFDADHRAFVKGAYQNLNIRISMDSLIRTGVVREMIVVTPNAQNVFDGSFYANSVTTGNWEDFIVRDLVGYMDRRYRTVRSRTGRGLAGHSMGGFGTLRVGMRHPETFSAIYALSPCCLHLSDSLDSAAIKTWKKVLSLTDRSEIPEAGFIPKLILALAPVYSPNPAKPPLFVDFPYRVSGDTLELVPDVWRRWSDDPLSMAASRVVGLKRMKIAFDAGTEDGFKDIPINVQKLDSLLTSLGVPHEAELYKGTHGSRIHERIESKVLPFFSKALR
jgi:S-formylglutathione hydrolase